MVIMHPNRIELIRKAHAVALAKRDNTEIEGVVHASIEDIQEETNGWTPAEEVDFDQDENLVNMDTVSPELKAIFDA